MHLGKWLKSARQELVVPAGLASLEKALRQFSEWGCVGSTRVRHKSRASFGTLWLHLLRSPSRVTWSVGSEARREAAGGGGAGEMCDSHAQCVRADKPRVIWRLRPCLNCILTWGVI